MNNQTEDYDATKQRAEDISKLVIEKYSELKSAFYLDDHITLMFSTGISVTIDFDIQWCRIHRKWVLQRGVDLSEYWFDAEECSKVIINHLSLI